MHVRNHGLWLFWPWLMSRYIFFHSIFITQSLQVWSLCNHGQIKQVPKADLRPGHVIHLLPCCIRKVHGWNTCANDTKTWQMEKQKKSYLCKEPVYCSTVFGRIHYVTMFMYQMLHIDLQCTSYVHDSTLRVSTKVATIPRSSVLPSIRPSWIQSKVLCEVLGRQQWLKDAQKNASLAFRIWFLLEVGVKQSAANIDRRNRAKVRIKCHRTMSIRTASARHWHSLVIKYMGHRTNASTASNKRLKFPWF